MSRQLFCIEENFMRIQTALYLTLPLLALSCKARQYNESDTLASSRGLAARSIIDAEADRFKNAHFEMFDNHSDTLFKLRNLYSAGKLQKDSKRTLIHFDYHSDLYRNNSHTENNINIGNYINTMIWKQDVDEVWWILPDETRSTKSLGNARGCASIKSQNELYWGRPNTFRDWQFRDGPADQLICMSASGAFSYKVGTATCPDGSKSIKFLKRTLGDLLALEKSPITGPTILDIDADFFDMSGNYANESAENPGVNIGREPKCYSLHYTPELLDAELKRFATVITQKLDLRPDYIAVARSPGYTVKNTTEIFGFLSHIGTKAKSASFDGKASSGCTTENANARVISDSEVKVKLPSGSSSTAKPYEPICVLKKEDTNLLVHFPLPPAGDAYIDPQYVRLCDTAKLNSCINGGGGEEPCVKRECTKTP
jgi:hypothetical protein